MISCEQSSWVGGENVRLIDEDKFKDKMHKNDIPIPDLHTFPSLIYILFCSLEIVFYKNLKNVFYMNLYLFRRKDISAYFVMQTNLHDIIM